MLTNSGEGHASIHVLVVDDDDGVLWTLKELLEFFDFEVATARSGSEALSFLNTHEPDCVLMDMRMPEQSGIDIFREIKPLKPQLPVIFMSGHMHSRLEDEALAEGAADVIGKPIDLQQLCRGLRRTQVS